MNWRVRVARGVVCGSTLASSSFSDKLELFPSVELLERSEDREDHLLEELLVHEVVVLVVDVLELLEF